MKTNKLCSIVLFAAALTGFGATRALVEAGKETTASASALWVFQTAELREMAAFADAIVVADARATFPGRQAYSDTGEAHLPFQVIQFHVKDAIKGAAPGEQLYVERAGGTDLEGDTVEFDFDGGAYAQGASYVLFLKRKPEDELYYVINDEARYDVNPRLGTLVAGPEPGPLALQLAGLRLDAAVERIRAAL
jgi:hypothetical protein